MNAWYSGSKSVPRSLNHRFFLQGEPNSKSNDDDDDDDDDDDEMAFRVKTGRQRETGEDEEELSSLVFRALRNCGIKFHRRP